MRDGKIVSNGRKFVANGGDMMRGAGVHFGTMKTVIAIFALLAPVAASAQDRNQKLTTPDVSPAASVSQTIGLTKIDVGYHRPATNGRKVWGGVVPYGEVWRAGANENTTVTFSSAVKVAGKPLKAGTYGLHMVPTAKDWTIVFSNTASAWGSYGYNQKEDALRVTVTPHAADMTERLQYTFDDPTDSQVTLSLRWEKLAVPIKIEVDTPQVVMASMRSELRGIPQFSWEGWNQAAQYWVNHGGNLDEAAKLADKSIQIRPMFQNRMTRAAIAEKKGDKKLAGELRAQALAKAEENDLNQYGYALLGQKKVDEAIAIFKKNVDAHPDSWNVHDSLGEALAIKGDKQAAYASYSKALSIVKDPAQKKRIETTLGQLKN
jgi:DUF2911 family protein